MRSLRTVTIVGCHAEGEAGDVIVGGVLDVPGESMTGKLEHLQATGDGLRLLLLNEPRGRASLDVNFLLAPCDARADAELLVMESDEWAAISGSNAMCAATVLLETGMLPMSEPLTRLRLDTVAGLVEATAHCEGGKCRAVAIDNVASFAAALGLEVPVSGLGRVTVDVAWGGLWHVLVDAASVGLAVDGGCAARLVDVSERIKRAVRAIYTPVHPDRPACRGVSVVTLTGPLAAGPPADGPGAKAARSAVVMSPGRLDRSPCGTGSSARMTVLHARGQLRVGETFRHQSIIGSEFVCRIHGTAAVGSHAAVLPTVQGRAWITGFRQVVLDPTDPYPEGFRVADQWPAPADPDGLDGLEPAN